MEFFAQFNSFFIHRMLKVILCQVRNATALIDFFYIIEKENKICVCHIKFEFLAWESIESNSLALCTFLMFTLTLDQVLQSDVKVIQLISPYANVWP